MEIMSIVSNKEIISMEFKLIKNEIKSSGKNIMATNS